MRHFIYSALLITLISCFTNKGVEGHGRYTISEIAKAIESDDVDQFNKQVAQIKNIDTLFQDGDNFISLLGYASQFGSQKITVRLIELGANIEIGMEDDFQSMDAIGMAVEHDNTEIVKLLIKHQANVNSIYNDNGLTPLVISCKHNSDEISTLLVDHGANVDGAGNLGGDYVYIPLFEAIKNNNYKIVKLLIEHGAKTNVIDNQGTSTNELLRNCDERIVKLVTPSE